MDENEQFRRALVVLQESGVVVLPTDTVYGLVAVATDSAAVRRLYEIKQRPGEQPLPLFVASIEQATLIARPNSAAKRLASAFWPGALTIVLPRRETFRTLASGGGDTLGVRVPDDPFLREAAMQLGPLTGTSANLSGRPEAHTAAEVRAQLGDAVDLIVDARIRAGGVASTVVDCTDESCVRIVRDGAVSRAQLIDALAGLSDVR